MLDYTLCNGIGHFSQDCRFKTVKCNKCQQVEHIVRPCRRKGSAKTQKPSSAGSKQKLLRMGRSQQVHSNEGNVDGPLATWEESPTDIVHIHAVFPTGPTSYKVAFEIDRTPITMEYDMEAVVRLVREAT